MKIEKSEKKRNKQIMVDDQVSVSDLEAKSRSIDAMFAAQGGVVTNNSMLSLVAAKKVANSKEAVLRKLLETQDTYIHELEAKCKAMSAQLMSADQYAYKKDGSPVRGGDKAIDLSMLETSQESAGDKIDRVIQLLAHTFAATSSSSSEAKHHHTSSDYSNPTVSNTINALQIIRNSSNLEDQVYQQRQQQHTSLIQTMQVRFQKEREEQRQLFDKNEQSLEQKILDLEQEIIVMRQHVRNFSQDEKTLKTKETLNTKVIEEIENMEDQFRKAEDQLRETNQDLRKQLQEANKTARDAHHQLQSIKATVNVSQTDEYACIKRIEGQMRLVFKEFKHADQKTQFVTPQVNRNPDTDLKIEKMLSQFNQQIQVLDDELDCEFSLLVSLNNGMHKQELLGSRSERQQQILLKDFEIENKALKEQIQKMQMYEQDKTQGVWVQKLEILDKEKKALQTELKSLVDISTIRESILTQEKDDLTKTISLLKDQASDAEQMHQTEIQVIKKQLSHLMQQVKQNHNQMSQSVLTGTPQAKQVAQDIALQNQSAQELLLDSQEQELILLRNLNQNLARQVKEANIVLGRPASHFDQQNSIGLIYSKLEVRFDELLKTMGDCLSNLEIACCKSRYAPTNSNNCTNQNSTVMIQENNTSINNQNSMMLYEFEQQLFCAREENMKIQSELDQAKMCLVQNLGSQNQLQINNLPQNSSQANDTELVNVIVAKFSQEIDRLKQENQNLKSQKDSVVHFYKNEFASLWSKFEEQGHQQQQQQNKANHNYSSQKNQQHLRQASEISEAQEITDELRELVQDVRDWILNLRSEEIKALQARNNMYQQCSSKTLKTTSSNNQVTTSRGKTNANSNINIIAANQLISAKQSAATLAYNQSDLINRVESNFSFNVSPIQQKLLQEEIEILREQVAKVADSYDRATKSRDVQFQVLAKERTLLRQRETMLDQALTDAIDAIQLTETQTESKTRFKQEREAQEQSHWSETNKALIERLESEKAINEKELAQVSKSYQEKFVQLKERETLLELQLAQLDKELSKTHENVWQMRQQKDDTVQSLNSEIASLKKFANQRQAELLETRRQVTLFYKKTKDNTAAREQEQKKLYKDSISNHVKILEIELKKLEKCSAKYEK